MIKFRRVPKSISVSVTRSMKSNVSSGTKPELLLAKLLRKRIVKNSLPGTPDFVYPKKKVAVFLHGCFWHRCPECALELPQRNRSFWAEKFENNMRRDKDVKLKLELMGWKVAEIWEHELRGNRRTVRERVLKHLQSI